MKLESLPPGWKATGAARRVSPLPTATGATVTLTAEGAYVPAAADGKMPFPLSITTDLGRRRQIEAHVAFIRAGRTTAPPKIDGRLDDWPMRAGSSAGTFKLVGRRGEVGDGLAKRQTLAFVLSDERNIYVAFRCDEPDMPALSVRSDNMIRYEQLMAGGEDLVEVILDPGLTAQTAQDLYHIVVKANGILITERGVRSEPPLGRVRSWSSGASVAVAPQDKLWVVEMAIPRSAFGPAGKEQFWGVNFTRFATQGSEGSSWSGAARYFYDPRNLGTMYVPSQSGAPHRDELRAGTPTPPAR